MLTGEENPNGRNPNGRKSQKGYACFVYRVIVSWTRKQQPIIALLSTEAEYIEAHIVLRDFNRNKFRSCR